jgi:hypothetical protein
MGKREAQVWVEGKVSAKMKGSRAEYFCVRRANRESAKMGFSVTLVICGRHHAARTSRVDARDQSPDPSARAGRPGGPLVVRILEGTEIRFARMFAIDALKPRVICLENTA